MSPHVTTYYYWIIPASETCTLTWFFGGTSSTSARSQPAEEVSTGRGLKLCNSMAAQWFLGFA